MYVRVCLELELELQRKAGSEITPSLFTNTLLQSPSPNRRMPAF